MNETEIKGRLEVYSEILNTLCSVEVVRTYNSSAGDYAEWIISKKSGIELQK